MSRKGPTILFAGGGTGGHLFPAIAIAERLGVMRPDVRVHFACSMRLIDQKILDEAGWPWTALGVSGMPERWWGWPRFAMDYVGARLDAMRMLRRLGIDVVVAMGGFVSGPVVMAARRRGLAVMLVNLDAMPGKANRMLARRCQHVYSVYPTERLGPFRTISMPLRSAAIGGCDRAEARRRLGFVADRPLLLVTGASQGAQTINEMMIELTGSETFIERMRSWQVLHLSGPGNTQAVEQAYLSRRVNATVLPFTEKMGLAWSAADVAISRAGAGSVAEVIANRTPTIFLPYPYHRDQHQLRNAGPLAEIGGAIVLEDQRQATANAQAMLATLMALLDAPDRLQAMRDALAKRDRGNSADELAERVAALAERHRAPLSLTRPPGRV